jgi:hypothetical protein
MIARRNGELLHRPKSIYLAMPTNTTLEQNSTSTGDQIGRPARKPQLTAVASRTNSESVEQRQSVTVWWMIALLWILFLLAGMVLWNKAALGF